jgi:dihydroorotate dehydrogenase (NAD+) catalytic subunit
MRPSARSVDTAVHVGDVSLRSPVAAASGCFGTGAELLGTVDAAALGAVVTKSLSPDPWPGNPAPRLTPIDGGGMLNAVGLQNPGVEHWRRHELPRLVDAGVTVVGSIWGRSPGEYERAAAAVAGAADDVAGARPGRFVAVEVNVSCPNLESANEMFAHHVDQTVDLVRRVRRELDAVVGAARPALWVKLSPNLPTLVPIASAAVDAGADAVVCTNTLIGIAIDTERRRPVLANGTGGVSGPPLRPVALRHVWEVHRALPDVPIVGVGGIAAVDDAVAFLLAGASAVEIGAAHLADPHVGLKIARGLQRWCRRHGVRRVAELTGAGHD